MYFNSEEDISYLLHMICILFATHRMSKDNLSDLWLSNVPQKTITNDISKNNVFIVLTSNSTKDPDPCTGVAGFPCFNHVISHTGYTQQCFFKLNQPLCLSSLIKKQQLMCRLSSIARVAVCLFQMYITAMNYSSCSSKRCLCQ